MAVQIGTTTFRTRLQRYLLSLAPSQTVFVLILVVDEAALSRAGLDPGAGNVVADVIVGALLVLAWVSTVRAMPAWLPEVVAAGNLVAVGCTRFDGASNATTALMVLPAVYLAHVRGYRGVATAAVVGALAVLLPVPFVDLPPGALTRSVISLIVAISAAVAVSVAVENVRQSQIALEAIVDASPVGLILVDAAGEYHSMNQQQDRIMRTAYPATTRDDERHVGHGQAYAHDGVTPLTADQYPSALAARGVEVDDLRIWVGRDVNNRRALSVSSRVLRDDAGRFLGASLACNDVTEFVRALQVKDEFVSSVSHELRTPLTSINGYTQMLLETDDLDPALRQQLEIVERNTRRLTRLVSDLLDVAQHGRGPQALVRDDCDLALLVAQAAESAAPAAAAKPVRLRHEPAAPTVVKADRGRVAQAVDNLITNAIKYTPAGGTVDVELTGDEHEARIRVSDTGIGMSADDRDRVFERFFRASTATSAALPGVGLGLAIVQDIVAAHHGRVDVESVPGLGSTFTIHLPREPGAESLSR